MSFEYRFRDGQGGGETQILEFVYAEPLKSKVGDIASFAVYTNPAFKEITVELPGQNEEFEADVFDMHGQVIRSLMLPVKAGKAVMDVSNLPGGSYTVLLKSKTGSFRSSFVKI